MGFAGGDKHGSRPGNGQAHDDAHDRASTEPSREFRFSEAALATIGHDLRNPLHAISAAAQLLRRRGADSETSAPIERILRGTGRLGLMVEQLLDLARSAGAGIAIAPEPVDLGELVAKRIAELPAADAARVTFAPVGEVRGKWDAVRLAQVVEGLLDNAIAHGGPEQAVEVSLDGGARDQVRLEVRNPGAIPEVLLSTLFEPFHGAGAAARSRKPRALGVGLYLAREIVEAHGGQIEAQSTADGGTTLRVWLPRISFARDDDEEDDDPDTGSD